MKDVAQSNDAVILSRLNSTITFVVFVTIQNL
jgi:hypothetical protein